MKCAVCGFDHAACPLCQALEKQTVATSLADALIHGFSVGFGLGVGLNMRNLRTVPPICDTCRDRVQREAQLAGRRKEKDS